MTNGTAAMYAEDQLLPISSLSEYVHCPRRFGLKLLEQAWDDNVFTAEGTLLHENVDTGKNESRGNVKITRSLRLRSLRLGITGIADVVEFHRANDATDDGWRPFPVEYKRGASKNIRCYEIQLCAQALCLEEMLGAHILEGALFLGEKQHRTPVTFDDTLRAETETACRAIHEIFAKGTTPPAEYNKRCTSCSLLETCLPKSAGTGKSARKWLDRQLADICPA
ncbi:MAG: CRISPR-associated protein Cas4 [Kiritimatiellaeota bacterium]|nr:CRISPR-associated protein Cas4 [Kiritimatiellota bacterium]